VPVAGAGGGAAAAVPTGLRVEVIGGFRRVRFNATVCRKGVTEKVATGSLDQLALHLPEVNVSCSSGLSDSFKLEVSETAEGFSWFTKSTVSGHYYFQTSTFSLFRRLSDNRYTFFLSFLYLVTAPDFLKSAHAIENEISQLEGARKFHLSLYTKDLPELSTSALEDNGDSEDGSTQKVKTDPSSDLTKNELLRALDLRLMALREELSVTFSRVLGSVSSTKQISDLAAFCQYFGAAEMRTSLLKYLELGAREHVPNASDQQTSALPHEVPSNGGNTVDILFQPVSRTDTLKCVRTGISPAKIAQAERQSSSESEEPSDSSDEDQPVAERSRPLIRSASPRRSASPMRRVQIGRSGSRRPTALTIKSLSYFPGRERTAYMDADGNGSGNEESERPPNRTESNVRRMSVQDAINLFESKQRDQNLNIQSRKGLNEISASTNKSVLRRWSAGMGESSKQCTQVTSSDVVLPNNSNNLVLQADEMTIQPESDITIADINKVEDSVDKVPAAEESVPSLLIRSATDLDVPKAEDIQEKPTDAAEWTRQKEAELNQMLMKLMESKPSKYRNTTSGNCGNPASERKGVIHRRYKEKGDVKLPQAETDRKQTEKEGQLKMMQETLDQRKAKMGSKASGVPGKLDSLSLPQKSRRNSSPPVLSKKEMPKSAAVRRPSPKISSPMPTTRSSWPSIPSPRTAGTPPSKASATTSTKNTASSGRKPQPMLSPSRRSPKPETSLLQSKGAKETQSEGKISSKGQENKKQSSTASSRSAKTKLSAPSGNNSAVSAKPTLYNKAKKSSVVPLESKPFLRKGTGSSQGVGSTIAKTLQQSDDPSRASGNLVPDEEKESVVEKTEAISEQPKEVLVEIVNSDDRKFDYPVTSDLNCEISHGVDPVVAVDRNAMKSVEIPTEESQPDEDLDISSAAWVEIDQQGTSESCDSGIHQMADSEIAPLPSSSPRVRHSLSQMLQADNGEMEILEWGNAENPPALIYQKDAPKGLKRLLKFGRKSREVSLAGWSSPSVFSEGEEDTEEARTNGKRSTDALLRKATVQTKGFGKQKTALSESYDGRYSSKRSMDHSAHDILSGYMRLITKVDQYLVYRKLQQKDVSFTLG
ncbi:hypothetical protein Taro_041802, partial [Colocasia esculenta]|nr:hypothetical protein [Colocasia esculenta]